jgi:hypothetical protein
LTGFDRFSTSRSDSSPNQSHTAIDNHRETVAMTTTHRISTTAVLIASLAAAGAPGASARPIGDVAPVRGTNPPPAAVYSRQNKSLVPIASPTPPSRIAVVRAPERIVRVQTPNSGFDWGDAGIGAAGGLALAMLGLGGALAVSQHRGRRTHDTTALTG